MPHKERQAYLDYMRRYHQRTRGSPHPQPQRVRTLPPAGVLLVEDDGSRLQCHVCGEWYSGLSSHIRVHGLTVQAYKERYGLARSTSLWSPEYQERQRQAALARGQGAAGRKAIVEIGTHPRPKGIANRLQSRIRSSEGHLSLSAGSTPASGAENKQEDR